VNVDYSEDTVMMDKLEKAFKGKLPVARVGVLGASNARKDQNTNAAIGAKHEFGDDGMPVRSFLRVPIKDNLEQYMEKSGFFNKNAVTNAIKQQGFVAFVTMLGVLGQRIVLDAFSSGGFGKWKPSDMTYKKNHQTLVETQQLRNSITWEVK
jgi:hypothetical protein